ncbi:MAG: AI-2E family transporter [Burkholderiales bacterium]
MSIIATLACLAVLRLGAPFFVPLMLAVIASYALTPMVNWMEAWHVPRALGAALVLLAALGGVGSLIYSHADDARGLIDTLPVAAEKLQRIITQTSGNEPSALEKVEKAAETLQESAAQPAPSAKPAVAQKGVVRVQVERQKFSVRDYLWTGTVGMLNGIGQALIVVVLAFFLLAAGSSFRRKLVKLTGSTWTEKRVTVEALGEISSQIQRYLLVMVLLSILTGVLTWGAFAALGLKNPAAWGALAGVFNLIPYIGSIAVSGAAILVAFVQFGTLEMALAIGAVSLFIHTIIGQFLTPWLTGKASQMNAVTMFVGVLAWGWLWGLWGLFLAVPILVIIKVVCDRVEGLKAIGEFLGD